ncbi:MAG: hypothetical protein KGM24_07630 [Elusimicrobia bacterium]|nr:hypothetical protein [Elusimicrobiota bacterium]
MKTLWTLPLLLAALAAPAAAEPGRTAALTALIAALPLKNPNADPSYFEFQSGTIADQLAACHDDPAEMAFMERLIAEIDRFMGPNGAGRRALVAELKTWPEFSGEHRGDLDSLSGGLMIAPDMVKASLVAKDCRTLLGLHYGNGASRDELLGAVKDARARLESEPAPKD